MTGEAGLVLEDPLLLLSDERQLASLIEHIRRAGAVRFSASVCGSYSSSTNLSFSALVHVYEAFCRKLRTRSGE